MPSKIAKTACVAELDNSDCATNVQSNTVLSGVPAVKPLCSDDNPACKVRHQATSATLGLCRSFIAGERWRSSITETCQFKVGLLRFLLVIVTSLGLSVHGLFSPWPL